jgi:hypothetical protein
MRIPIPPAFDRCLDWLAQWLLPPPKPIGVKLFGYAVTWLDLYVWGLAAAGGVALSLYFGDWLWLLATAVSMVLALMMFEWLF